jgi:hypothetical protein
MCCLHKHDVTLLVTVSTGLRISAGDVSMVLSQASCAEIGN